MTRPWPVTGVGLITTSARITDVMADILNIDPTAFEHLFEHSPWVVQRALLNGPFLDVTALHGAMMQVVRDADIQDQLALIRAHPELGAKVALTDASNAEQQGAGLQALSEAEFEKFSALNKAYREKFGFPFIICVRLHHKASILAAFEQRLQHSADAERAATLDEIGKITMLRLQDLRS